MLGERKHQQNTKHEQFEHEWKRILDRQVIAYKNRRRDKENKLLFLALMGHFEASNLIPSALPVCTFIKKKKKKHQ